MYSKFNCTDLTSNFTPDLTGSCTDMTANFGSNDMTSDFYASANGTTGNSLENIKNQLLKATADLDAQNKIYADNKAYWDACKWRSPAFRRAGYYQGDTYRDSECKAARDKMNAAKTKIDGLTKNIENYKLQIEQFKSTDPELVRAQGAATAAIEAAKITSEAGAGRTKVIGWTIAGVIVLTGVVWAVVKLRKK